MQEFFKDYGLWLLIALLVVIGLIFLLSGRKPSTDAKQPPVPAAKPVEKVTPAAPAPSVPAAPVIASVAVATPPPPPPPVKTVPVEPTPAISEPVAPEPVAAEALDPEPVLAPVIISPAATAAPQGDDDLSRLKGVGPKLKTLLTDLGITNFAQVAAWTDTDIAAIDAKLGNFKGRPVRDQWVDQAKYLASGDTAGFEAKYGKL